ncbi:adrenomedullin a [Hypomesus transpacificus]|uniref:adrenomedullin a n=1 Tax=Hypomesus transpacificus TaxID=137520 RepID=UPI001F0864DA|nr:adrenomedullin a [Hypomesus transpacificus]
MIQGFQAGDKMKLIFQSFLCSCLLATVAHSVEFEMSPELKKRLSVWMQSRLRRDLNSVSERRAESGQFVRPEDFRDTLTPHSSTDFSVRTKRSKNSVNQYRRPGCSLGTCTVHDLAHRLHQLNNKLNIGSAPMDKISPQGYGRRRRSLPKRRATLRLEGGRLRPTWSSTSRAHKLEALLRRT